MNWNSDDTEPLYVISIAARMTGIQTYTLRYYEKIGIIEPARSGGNIRLYSERDVALLRQMKTLMEDLGVNLAGVEVVLRMSQRMLELQNQVEELGAELRRLKGAAEKALNMVIISHSIMASGISPLPSIASVLSVTNRRGL